MLRLNRLSRGRLGPGAKIRAGISLRSIEWRVWQPLRAIATDESSTPSSPPSTVLTKGTNDQTSDAKSLGWKWENWKSKGRKLDDFTGNGYFVCAGIAVGAFTSIVLVRATTAYADIDDELFFGFMGGFVGGIFGISPHLLISTIVLSGSIAASVTITRALWPPKKREYHDFYP